MDRGTVAFVTFSKGSLNPKMKFSHISFLKQCYFILLAQDAKGE